MRRSGELKMAGTTREKGDNKGKYKVTAKSVRRETTGETKQFSSSNLLSNDHNIYGSNVWQRGAGKWAYKGERDRGRSELIHNYG
ncbi:hypothetical protein EXN66_Car018760 [Channa argus]|uniref:Uncharacterized protein n=1 Tax=Channa argus TaxID=215402 RepID=A0A6G1QKJ5_CHAAH|nr:hypothetical protein EXN66_Car018760 [Channa argus]